ncbi:MAG TPA: MATE family efflux transporter [Methanothrix sp.]|nr:MATE family efflux transporter [Methanothrix sp.]HPJ83393.1 MATE family efflux transporter [Methanothrix sp.]HPR67056.1 MATE family efflux transporter [Methanothrix sp.]
MMVGTNPRLTEGPIQKNLVLLTIPMVFGTVSMVIFNLADTFFVGRLGTDQLAAMSFTYPVVLFINSLAHAVGIGAAAVISRTIGEGDHDKVRRLTADGLILSVLFVCFIVPVGLFTIDPLFRLLGASSDVMIYIHKYMIIWYFGVIFVVAPMVGTNAIRASGNTKTPAFIMIFAAGANIVLDPILIFGWGPFPRLEIAGAAVATVIARAMTLVLALYFLYYKDRMLTVEMPSFDSALSSWRQILYIGLPNAGVMIITPFAAGVITSIVASYGSDAVAGFGVATRIDSFALIVIMALASVMGPFIGQNWGASNFDRIRSGMKFSYLFSLIWGLAVFSLLAVFGDQIGSVFSDDPGVVSVVGLYLSIVPLGYGLYGVLVNATTAMSVLKKPIESAILTIFQTFILYIPMAYIGSSLAGLRGVFFALPISYLVSAVIANHILNIIITSREGTTKTAIERNVARTEAQN